MSNQYIETQLDNFKVKVNEKNEVKCEQISKWINIQVELDKQAFMNNRRKKSDENNYHPIKPKRGEVFMAEMGCNVGFEFNNYHPVLIIQNDNGNLYSDKTVVLPITGLETGEKLDLNVNKKITNDDFESMVKNGLDKNPSKIKVADITTIDKARLRTKIGMVNLKFLKDINFKLRKLLDL